MDLEDFITSWDTVNRDEVVRMIDGLRHDGDSAAGEIDRLRCCTELDATLRRSHRCVQAGRAGVRAGRAVLAACRRLEVLDDDRAGTTLLARAASDAARALVAGGSQAGVLLERFGPTLASRRSEWARLG